MQIGYNNDVEYRDKTFHIQTEDHGQEAASIETQIFHGGAILDTSIISYEKMLSEVEDVDERIERIRNLMQGNHKKLYKKLFAGMYDEMVGLDPVKKSVDEIDVDEGFVPAQEAVPAAALEIEKGNLEAFENHQPMGEAVDLSTLQEQLNADAAKAEALAASGGDGSAGDGSSEVEVAPTMMLTPGDIADTQEVKSVARASRNGTPVVDHPETGASAWRGCDPPRDELDIINLVEEFAGG